MADVAPSELLELFQRAQAAFTDRVDAVEPGQWELPALPGWTVADLVAHLVGEAHWAPGLLAGDPLDVVAAQVPEGTDALLAPDPLTSWEGAADEALAAVAAADLASGTVHLSRGPTPAAEYVEEMTADLTVHSWDLARATGGDEVLDPALVRAAGGLAARLPDGGVPGLFGPPVPVPDGASPQDRLLARFGRRP
ncbi:TIGR03086 family metal-binding protein [Geodermatophilus sp. DSM 44513]|uniref:TIGR03086 family metal-binding protein n=1 Tax=Geodermatophilus sp. DSM 44513 TaxID=1528104 RepID=UPI0012763552|nr:TIGR03086 family metal-binding protein [Geodermatophilus sp. DSM 44513]WNV74704.1 TIGR03086 family metal-binding protein [Geodermatophilus sp. DSM 44513]